jgi:surfeit locus 1 family protein
MRDNLPLLLFKRRWILTTLFVLVASVIMIRLGFWQIGRLEGKRAFVAQSLAQIEAEPLIITGDETDLDGRAIRHRPATAQGQYDFANEVALKNKSYMGRLGYHILTPMRIDGSERAVLVDRGWISSVDFDASEVGLAPEILENTAEGRIAPPDFRPKDAKVPAEPRLEWYRVDIEGIQSQMPYELLPFFIALTPSESDQRSPIPNPPEIVLDEGPHLAYAIQWFVFAAVVPLVYAFQVRKMDAAKSEPRSEDS